MNSLLVYAIEVNFYLAIFAAIYWFALKNEAYYQLNRGLILGLIALSFSIPFMQFSQTGGPVFAAELETVVISAKKTTAATPMGWNFPSALTIIYMIGAAIALTVLGIQLLGIAKLLKASKSKEIGEATLVEGDAIKAPGSFFKKIFWSDSISDHHSKWIMDHEMVHVNEKHSIDVIVIRLAQVACWFNPAIYLLKTELEATHEFQADKVVSQTHDSTETYSKVLLGQALGVDHRLLAHHFSKPNLLKRRIIMLNKQQNNRKALAKYALLIPTLVLALTIHSCTKDSTADGTNPVADNEQVEPQAAQMIEGTDVYKVVEKMPEYPGGKGALMTFLGENIKYPESCKEDGIEGTVFLSFVIDEDGLVKDIKTLKSPDDRLRASALETVSKMQAWEPGQHDGKNVKVQFTLPIRYAVE